MVNTKIIPSAPNAYEYPLLIKNLLVSGPRYNPDQEIVYARHSKYTYTDLVDRVHRLANALTDAGVGPGDVVAVLDWDTPRYLECFFAIPMIGAVLHTVNVRLSPEQIVYTMNHAEDHTVLVHDDFVPLLEQVRDQLTTVKGYIQLTDEAAARSTTLPTLGDYERCWQRPVISSTSRTSMKTVLPPCSIPPAPRANPWGCYSANAR